MDSLAQAVALLQDLTQDASISKNAKMKLANTIGLLQQTGTMNVAKAMNELETMSDDSNMPSHLRTQLFSVVSLLEIV